MKNYEFLPTIVSFMYVVEYDISAIYIGDPMEMATLIREKNIKD